MSSFEQHQLEPQPLRTPSASHSTVPSYHLRPEDIPNLSRPPTSMMTTTATRVGTPSSSSFSPSGDRLSNFAAAPTAPSGGRLTPIEASELGLKQSRPNLLFLESGRKKGPTSRGELRYRVLSSTPTVRLVPDDSTWNVLEKKKAQRLNVAPTPAVIDVQLTEDLQHISESDRYRRLNAHRLAFEKYVALQEPSSQILLRKILKCYEEIELHQFTKHVEELTVKLTAAESVARDAIAERNALRLHVDALRLDLNNMERSLHAKTEMLSEIAAVHKINLANVNWMNGTTTSAAGGGGAAGQPSRTMAEIRAVQRQVQARHSDAAKLAERQETAQAMRRREDAERLAEEIQRVASELDHCELSALDGVAAAEIGGANEDDGLDDGTTNTESTAAIYVASQDTMKNGVDLEMSMTPRAGQS